MNVVFKFYHQTLGAHMHFRVFSGEEVAPNTHRNFGKSGDLSMTKDEGQAFLEVLKRGSGDGGKVLILEDK